MHENNERNRLIDLVYRRSYRRGDFILASGAHSSFYIDARLTTMSGEGQVLIGKLGLIELDRMGWHPDLIGGLTLGADPVAYAIAHHATLEGRTLDAFTVRKEPKQHGTGRVIEGPFSGAPQVVIVEDVVTTGESALRAAKAVRNAGGIVMGLLAVVDRQEGGREKIAQEGLELAALVTLEELNARG